MTGAVAETPKAGDPAFQNVHNVVIGSNEIAALLAALHEAQKQGYNAALLSTYVEGEARQVAVQVPAALGKECVHSGNPLPPPACLSLRAARQPLRFLARAPGDGIRNWRWRQRLPWMAGRALLWRRWRRMAATGQPMRREPSLRAIPVLSARGQGLAPLAYLENNDSYHFFQQLGDAVVTGPTGTNVNDLAFILVR